MSFTQIKCSLHCLPVPSSATSATIMLALRAHNVEYILNEVFSLENWHSNQIFWSNNTISETISILYSNHTQKKYHLLCYNFNIFIFAFKHLYQNKFSILDQLSQQNVRYRVSQKCCYWTDEITLEIVSSSIAIS